MSEPGTTTDQSRERPSRRADLSSHPFETPRRRPRFARLRRTVLTWRQAPQAGRTTDYTIEEGDPTERADVGLSLK
jgi:hypothetical protein